MTEYLLKAVNTGVYSCTFIKLIEVYCTFYGTGGASERCEMRIKFWSENLKGRDHLKEGGVDERTILKRILKKFGALVCTRVIWIRIETGDENL
jgi:hypothetical protein